MVLKRCSAPNSQSLTQTWISAAPANCGGLLGLFSGFSLLGLVELLYFMSIRLWVRLCRGRGRSQRQSPDAEAQVRALLRTARRQGGARPRRGRIGSMIATISTSISSEKLFWPAPPHAWDSRNARDYHA